jgi:uroporphyrinogen-III synthase
MSRITGKEPRDRGAKAFAEEVGKYRNAHPIAAFGKVAHRELMKPGITATQKIHALMGALEAYDDYMVIRDED